MEKLQTLSGHEGRVWHIDWSPSGDLLASCGCDKKIYIWKLEHNGWQIVDRLDGSHTKSIRKVKWSRSGALLASASFDGTVVIWKQTSGSMEAALTLEGHENEVKGLSWSIDDKYLATCSRDKTIWIWETDIDFEYDTHGVLSKHTQDIKEISFHQTQYLLISASYDNTITIWSLQGDDWICINTLLGHESTVWDIKWLNNDIISVSDDLTLKYWQLEEDNKHHLKKTISGVHSRSIYSVDCSENIVVSVFFI
jgi:WD40 repeat protein